MTVMSEDDDDMEEEKTSLLCRNHKSKEKALFKCGKTKNDARKNSV